MTRVGMCAVLGAVVFFLGIASWITTEREVLWRFPSGRWFLRVVSEDGSPVTGARVETNDGPPHPFSESSGSAVFRTGDDGRVLLEAKAGFRGGRHEFRLFWMIPIGSGKLPDWRLHVSAAGHSPVDVEVWSLVGRRGDVLVVLRAVQ
jgi:hypothetical protein